MVYFHLWFMLLLIGYISLCQAWKSCSAEDGGGVCPNGNHCCRTSTAGVSSCIPETLHPHNGTGMCCDDVGLSGCGPGYGCETTTILNESTKSYLCFLVAPVDNASEPAPEVLPQYKLCTLTQDMLQLQTLPVNSTSGGRKLAYFSSMGSLEGGDMLRQHQPVTHIFINIHGSGRNADDYFCAGLSSVFGQLQNTTMVIAPWFLAPGDDDSLADDILRWNETGPILHPWRYGAEATDGVTSSYQAMDAMVESIMLNAHLFPNLQRIIVGGHSAGGQFTHRWALTSNAAIWGDSSDSDSNETTTSPINVNDDRRLVPIRVVAANPRSFCYLDNRRYNNAGELVEPAAPRIDKCPGYNRWEWGLEMDSRVPMPHHVRKQIEEHGGDTTWLTDNYAKRDVVYLAGKLDILPVHSECEDDDFQGAYRLQRSKLYFDSLQDFYKAPTHHRLVVDGVNHDHCLMFQSAAGQRALFGDFFEQDGTLRPAKTEGSIAIRLA